MSLRNDRCVPRDSVAAVAYGYRFRDTHSKQISGDVVGSRFCEASSRFFVERNIHVAFIQVVPGLVGAHHEWKRIMAKTVDEGMDQKATVEGIAKRKVSNSDHVQGRIS